MNIYRLTYTQESEAFILADSESEAVEYITEYTSNGGENMHTVRLNECGWSVTEDYGKAKELSEIHEEHYTHKTEDGSHFVQDGKLFWD